MSINIRQATTGDLDALYSIERECFTTEAFTKKQLRSLLESPESVSLIARIGSEIAGFIVGSIYTQGSTKMGRVYTIDVAVKHRRKRVGLRLLKELEQRLTEAGAEFCWLEARVGNTAALELYRMHGYAEVDILENFYSEGISGIRFVKKLSSSI